MLKKIKYTIYIKTKEDIQRELRLNSTSLNHPSIIDEIETTTASQANVDESNLVTIHDYINQNKDKILNAELYVFNHNRIKYIHSIINKNRIDGVIYHVLKGHVCYDFELDFIEDMFNSINIPVFRLETDYNEQDVEQLRIRTEAFYEMLSINKQRAI